MSFERAYISLIINGIMHTKDELLEKKWMETLDNSNIQNLAAPWLQSFQGFLENWLDEKDYVSVNTSGSTGKPKKIQLSKERMMNSAFMTGKYFDFKTGKTALLCLPCEYISGKMMVVRAMMWGLDLRLVSPSGNPISDIKDTLEFAAMVPIQVSNIFEQSPEKFLLINQLIIGGGKVNITLLEKLQTVPTQCFATYGMTETITHVALKKLNGPNKSDYYKALPNIKFSVDKRGCFAIDAPKLSSTIVQTNDIVYLKDSSTFEWLGRFDNVINTGGVKVFPEKIEAKIEKILEKRFFITSLSDDKLENKVVLIIEDEVWEAKKIDALKLVLKKVLSKFEQPKQIYFLDHFVETPTKKIQRNRTKKKLNKFNL